MEIQRCEIPDKLGFLFEPHRYKVAYGGRGSAKSWTFARVLLVLAASSCLRVLCAREFQNSIQESVHKLLVDQMGLLGLQDEFEVTQQSIKSRTDSDFFFYGIKNNPTKIKSTEGIDIAWVEEAERVSNNSWEILIPTIRKPGSEIWMTFNPHQETDATYQRFVINPPDDCVSREINHPDNPWFPVELRKEMEYLARVDPDAYAHIYGGKTRKFSAAQVLNGKWFIEYFEPASGWNGPYQGADWGFAEDPTVLIRCWVHENKLYVEYETWQVGLDIDKTPDAFDKIPDARKYVTRADSARPETISYMQRNGYSRMVGVKKGPESVNRGVLVLRAFEKIVIHPRCKHAQDEARLWSYKTDPITGDVTADLVKKHDHTWDSIRYALEPGHDEFIKFMAGQHAEAKAKKEEERKRLYG
jgi:phage terminase large subunit